MADSTDHAEASIARPRETETLKRLRRRSVPSASRSVSTAIAAFIESLMRSRRQEDRFHRDAGQRPAPDLA